MRGSRKFCHKGSSFYCKFFLVDGGKRIQIQLKVGHHRHASEKPFKWRFPCVPMMAQYWWLGTIVFFQEIQINIAKKPYIFVIFQARGGGASGPPVPLSESAHAFLVWQSSCESWGYLVVFLCPFLLVQWVDVICGSVISGSYWPVFHIFVWLL